MQFALGSVLKLTRSAFGGLGSFRTPSIRRALPVLLGGLLCAVGSAAMAQSITDVKIEGTPGTDLTYSTAAGSGTSGTTPAGNNQFSVVFTYAATVGGGTSGTAIVDVGGKQRSLTCGAPSGATLTCGPYTVMPTDVDSDGVSVPANSLSGDYPSLGHAALPDQSGHKVDGMSPSVASVTVTSDPGSDGAYRSGDTVTATVSFTESVASYGTFGVTLVVGAKVGDLCDGSAGTGVMTSLPQSPPTTTLSFSYTVGCENADAIKVSLTGVDGIRDAAGNTGVHKDGTNSSDVADFANLDVSYSGVSPQRIDNTEPTVASVRLDTAEPNPEFGNGDDVEVAVEFTEPVIVSGDPLLRMHLNGTTDEKRISYVSGSGTYTLLFRWRVPAGEDGNDLQIPANALVLAGGASITDSAGNAADNTVAGTTGSDIAGTVDSRVPTVNQADIAVEGTAGDGVGDTIDINVPIIEDGTAALVVTGTPTLSFSLGGRGRSARFYEIPTGSPRVLRFSYTIAPTDASGRTASDSLALSVSANAIRGGTIADMAGNLLDRTHAEKSLPAITWDDTADTADPNCDAVETDKNTPYGRSSTIRFTLKCSEDVTAVGSPSFTFTIGTDARSTTSTSAAGRKITFQYRVNNATDNGDLGDPAVELSTTKYIRDLSNNRLDAPGDISGLSLSGSVDTDVPVVTDVEIVGTLGTSLGQLNPSDNNYYYGAGDEITVDVTMNETVVVKGKPTLALRIGSVTRQARFEALADSTGGTTNAKLTFKYRVATADSDPNGISVPANALGSAGTIEDLASNAANRALGAHAITDDGAHPVDGMLGSFVPVDPGATDPDEPAQTVPGPTNATPLSRTPPSGYYDEGDEIRLRIQFSEDVTFQQKPTLTLNFDSGPRSVRANEPVSHEGGSDSDV